MYCVKCGVELSDTEKRCPLCGTPVFHPDISRPEAEPQYPSGRPHMAEEVNRSGVLFVLTVLLALPAVLSLLCDWRINGGIVWSGYVSGAIGMLYVIVMLPMWFRKPNAAIFVPVDFVAIGLYLLYIDFAVNGHWFLSFAFPVTGGVGLIATAMVVLLKYLRGGQLFVFGGALILSGGFMVLVEFLLNLTFKVHKVLFWSIYPLAAGFILGMMLIVIGACRPLRESLHKKFFL